MIEIRPQENSGDQGERKNGGTTVRKSPNGLSAGVAAALVSQGALTMTRRKRRGTEPATLASPGDRSERKRDGELEGTERLSSSRVESSGSCSMQNARCDVERLMGLTDEGPRRPRIPLAGRLCKAPKSHSPVSYRALENIHRPLVIDNGKVVLAV